MELGLALGLRVVADGLEVDGCVAVVGPAGLTKGQEAAEGVEAEAEHPLGLALEGGDGADGILGEALGDGEGLDVGDEAPLVVPLQEPLDRVVVLAAAAAAATAGGAAGPAVGLDGSDPEGGFLGVNRCSIGKKP